MTEKVEVLNQRLDRAARPFPLGDVADAASSRSLFNGLAQVIVQTTKTPGTIALTASSQGLTPATLTLESVPAPIKPSVPPAQRRHFITDWRMSAITSHPPDVNQRLLEQDVNSWDRVEAGHPQAAWGSAQGYAIYRAKLTLPRWMRSTGGRLKFHELAGSAEIFIDAKPVAQKQNPAATSLIVPIDQGTVSTDVAVILKANSTPAGMTGRVEILAP